MSHELPLASQLDQSVDRLPLARSDGELTTEQEKQVQFIRQAAEGLATLVDDVLDLAKVEAGKAVVRPVPFEAISLFDSLDGTMRPMVAHEGVSLVFEPPTGFRRS